MRLIPITLVCVLVAFPVGSLSLEREAFAEDETASPVAAPHTDTQLEEAEVFDRLKAGLDSDDIDDQLRILKWFGQWRHKKVLRELKKMLRRERDLERMAAIVEGLGNQAPWSKDAGRAVLWMLDKNDGFATGEEPFEDEDEKLQQALEAKVLIQGIRAIGKLQYKDAFDDIVGFIDHHHDFVAGETMLAFGRMKEYRALPVLQDWFNFYPDGQTFGGGSVTVDTGAPGGEDARAARSKWMRKYGGRRRQARPNAHEMLVDSLEMITGVRFEKPAELKQWMEDNEDLLKRHGV